MKPETLTGGEPRKTAHTETSARCESNLAVRAILANNRRFVDLREMPDWNTAVTNGSDSISRGVIYVKILWGIPYPYHVKYGALNKVTPEGIWRCLMSHEGCWEIS